MCRWTEAADESFLDSAHVGVQLVPVTVHEKHLCCWQENF